MPELRLEVGTITLRAAAPARDGIAPGHLTTPRAGGRAAVKTAGLCLQVTKACAHEYDPARELR